VAAVDALLLGLKAAVLAVVVDALLRIGRRVLHSRAKVCVAAAAFCGIFVLRLPFPLLVLGAGALGFLVGRASPGAPGGDAGGPSLPTPAPTAARALRVVLVWGLLWVAPIAALALLGAPPVYLDEAAFFSKVAVVTFGGAYAVLAYVAQEAVERFGWLSPAQMLDGLGLAETTPGPLILVLQFVGFLGAYHHPGPLPPLLAGALGAALTTWVTFVPCFLWIFLGAPHVERLRGNRRLAAALEMITAAVVGVILNLAVWFALHVFFAEVGRARIGFVMSFPVPVWSTAEPFALLLSAAAFVALLRFRVGMLPVLGASMAAGIAFHLVR
jgi:chromate transporter